MYKVTPSQQSTDDLKAAYKKITSLYYGPSTTSANTTALSNTLTDQMKKENKPTVTVGDVHTNEQKKASEKAEKEIEKNRKRFSAY